MEYAFHALASVIPLVGLLVISHELGHYLTARIFGMKILEFGFGFPPRMFGIYTGNTIVYTSERCTFEKGDVVKVSSRMREDGELDAAYIYPKKYKVDNYPGYLHHEGKIKAVYDDHIILADMIYSINWLPFGGFVRPVGDGELDTPKTIEASPPWQRLIVVSAGVVINLLLIPLLFIIIAALPHQVERGDLSVVSVHQGSPAERGGLQAGDIIVSINDITVESVSDFIVEVQTTADQPAEIEYQRGNITNSTLITPEYNGGQNGWYIGINAKLINVTTENFTIPIHRVVPAGMALMGEIVGTTANIATGIVSSGNSPVSVAGPVGLVDVIVDASRNAGLRGWLLMAAFLSFNLAVINFLPFPALDGGRAVFIALEWVRGGKRIPQKADQYINRAGFAVLILIMVAVTFNDITNLTGIDLNMTKILMFVGAIVIGGVSFTIAKRAIRWHKARER